MAEQPQTIVQPAAPPNKPKGARNQENLQNIFSFLLASCILRASAKITNCFFFSLLRFFTPSRNSSCCFSSLAIFSFSSAIICLSICGVNFDIFFMNNSIDLSNLIIHPYSFLPYNLAKCKTCPFACYFFTKKFVWCCRFCNFCSLIAVLSYRSWLGNNYMDE